MEKFIILQKNNPDEKIRKGKRIFAFKPSESNVETFLHSFTEVLSRLFQNIDIKFLIHYISIPFLG